MASFSVQINPLILRWAREEGGYLPEQLANKIDKKAEDYRKWEETGKNVPFQVIEKIAQTLKRPVAAFFLPEPPVKMPLPGDYRNLAGDAGQLSPEVRLHLRDAIAWQNLAAEINPDFLNETTYSWITDLGEYQQDIEKQAHLLRDRLGITTDIQRGFRDDAAAYKTWRKAVEEHLSILVFQFPLPAEEVQGFSLVQKAPFVAAVTTKKLPHNARIFTLFHEVAHILRRHSGICLPNADQSNSPEELACNQFAGAVLMPEELMQTPENLERLYQYASQLKVSREAYLRRLLSLNKIDKGLFFNWLKTIQDSYSKTNISEEKKSGGGVSPRIKSKSQRGETFYNLVWSAFEEQRLAPSQAAQFLGLNLREFI